MEFSKRKRLRLKDYDYGQNNSYYITICTHKREDLFGKIVGAALCGRPNNPDKIIQKWLLAIENKYPGIKIDKYTIMPDHVHFILSIMGDHAGSPLPQMIGWFKTMIANEYLKGVKNGLFPPFNKHLWQRSYYEHIIRNEQEYREIWEYIDTNILKGEKGPPRYIKTSHC